MTYWMLLYSYYNESYWVSKKAVLWLDFDLQFSSFTLSGVSVNTVHYAGSNNPHTERKYIDRQKL